MADSNNNHGGYFMELCTAVLTSEVFSVAFVGRVARLFHILKHYGAKCSA